MIKIYQNGREIQSLYFGNLILDSESEQQITVKAVEEPFSGKLRLDGSPQISISEDGENFVKSLDIVLNVDEEKDIFIKVNAPIWATAGSYAATLKFITEGENWEDWQYQCAIDVSGDMTGYDKVMVQIQYCENILNEDLSDLRFVTEDGEPLDYAFVNDNVLGASSYGNFVVVKTDGLTHFYALAGNPNAESADNPDIVEIYDDCEGNLSDNWEVVSGSASIETVDGKPAIKLQNDTILKSKEEINYAYMVVMKVYFTDGTLGILTSQDSTPSPNEKYFIKLDNSHCKILINGNDPPGSNDRNQSLSTNTWYDAEIMWNTGGTYQYQLILKADDWYPFYYAYFNDDLLYPNGYIGLYYAGEGYGAISDIRVFRLGPPTYYSTPRVDGAYFEENTFQGGSGELSVLSVDCTWNVIGENISSPPKETIVDVAISGRSCLHCVSEWTITKSSKETPGSFRVVLVCPEDEIQVVTGTRIEFKEKGMPYYRGTIDRVDYEVEPGRIRYVVSGRDSSTDLLLKSFQWPSSDTGQMYSSYDILSEILEGTGIELGPSVDITAQISDNNTSLTGFAGGWESRAKALNELVNTLSYIIGEKLGWYIDSEDKLRTYRVEAPQGDVVMRIKIFDNPRLTYARMEENAENIINRITIVTEQGTQTFEDEESIRGWTDSTTAYHWPGYGVREQLYSEQLSQSEAAIKGEEELSNYSKPIYTVELKLEGLVNAQVGQPLMIEGYRKFQGSVFMINRVIWSGDASSVKTEITATTDRTITGSFEGYDAIKAISKNVAKDFAVYTGRIEHIVGSNPYPPYYEAVVTLNEINATIRIPRLLYPGDTAGAIGCPIIAWKTRSGMWIGTATCWNR